MSALNRLQITWRAAQDIEDGEVVNLGIGLPVHCSDYLRPEVDVILQSENGVIGVGPLAEKDKADTDLVDAGSRRITLMPGGSIIDFKLVVRDDPRRAYRRHDFGRVRGGGKRRPRQLGHARPIAGRWSAARWTSRPARARYASSWST